MSSTNPKGPFSPVTEGGDIPITEFIPDMVRRIDELTVVMEQHPEYRDGDFATMSKTLYYNLDFLKKSRRTLVGLSMSDLEAGNAKAWDEFEDCWGRCFMTQMQIESGGDAAMQIAMGMQPISYGKDILEKAKELVPKGKPKRPSNK